jgi:hypothetical protein
MLQAAAGISKARRAIVREARRDAEDESSERALASLEPARRHGEVWGEDETLLAYELLKRQRGFPPASDITVMARQLGRSVGSVARKLANLEAAESKGKHGLAHRSQVDDRVVSKFGRDVATLRRSARRVRRERHQPIGVGPKRQATRNLHYEFWSALNKLVDQEGSTIKTLPASQRHWYGVRLGRSGFQIGLTIATRESRVGCELYISHAQAKQAFGQLEAERDSIEAVLGPLEWQPLPGKQACRIVQYRHADLRSHEQWPQLLSWCKERAEAFDRTFASRVRTLLLTK